MSKLSLEDFIFETLTSISKGVMRAKRKSSEDNEIPIALTAVGGESTELGEQLVRFSVSLEVSSENAISGNVEAKAGLISVLSGRIGAEAGNANSDRSAHVVEFSVPMNFDAAWRLDGEGNKE